jgi:osmotically-inducible protein OsmY
MSISSRAKFSALPAAVVTTCLLLAGLSPAYGQATAPQVPSLTQQTSRHTVTARAQTAHKAVHHTRTRTVARKHRYPSGPSSKVNVALRADPTLTGSQARPLESGGVALHGTVFDEPQRIEAERIAMHVHGVKYVINDLKTTTGQWMDEQIPINNALLRVDSLQGVSARVIGPQVYLSGQVNSEADKARAVQLASEYSHLEVVDMIRVVPPSIFSIAWWS